MTKIINEKQQTDLNNFVKTFYSVYDQSIIELHYKHIIDSPAKCSPIGEGTHFTAYKINSYQYDMDLVLSIAKDNFLNNKHKIYIDEWINNLKKIQGLSPLIPPFKTLALEDDICIITPYGSDKEPASHWQPIENIISNTREILSKNRLIIEDYLQIKTWHSIPFIYDFSDLKLQP